MLDSYLGIAILAALVVAFAIASLALSDILGLRRRAVGKGSAYESGMTPIGGARLRLSIHFYLVAVLFILFDVESIFLVPWAVAARTFAQQGVGAIVFGEIAAFVLVLGVGLAYVWRRGGLEWDR